MCRSPHHSSCDLLADLFDWYNTIKKLSLLHKPHIVVLIEKMALFSVNNTGITYSGSACFQACRSSYICYFLNLIYILSFQIKLLGRSLPSLVNSAMTFTYTLLLSIIVQSLLSIQSTHADVPYDQTLHHMLTVFCHGT